MSRMVRFGIWYGEFGWKFAFLISIIVSMAIVLSSMKVAIIILCVWILIALILSLISNHAKRWLTKHNF